MRIVEFAVGQGRAIGRFGSVGAHRLGGVRFSGGGGWNVLELDAGGHLGRHPTLLAQLFVVVDGSGWVAGADGVRVAIGSGEAALWDPGEEHESGSEGGVRVVVLEGRRSS
jgi:hypothetical protein